MTRIWGVPVVDWWLTALLSIQEDAGSTPGLAWWVKGSGIARSCGVGHRLRLDPVLLWLWHGPATTAPIVTPTLGTSICHRSSPKKPKKKKKGPECGAGEGSLAACSLIDWNILFAFIEPTLLLLLSATLGLWPVMG